MMVTFLSHMMKIDWLHDEIQLVPMMGIDSLIPSPDWNGLGPESV